MFEKDAIRHAFEDTIGVECLNKPVEDFTYEELSDELQEKAYDFQQGAEFGYNKANEEHEGKCKTAYIKGIRTMANALKDYDRTEGAWTDYFEHTVEEVLKRLLKE